MPSTKLTGLVACGGQSLRMGFDKSLIRYREKAQRYYLYDILSEICPKALISCREDQTRELPYGYEYVIDHPQFLGKGPATALLSAFVRFPDSPMLLIACDYPFIDQFELKHFLESIKDPKKPHAFYNPDAQIFIPVLAYYPAEASADIIKQIEEPGYSLMQYLKTVQATKYIPRDLRCLISADSPEASANIKLV